MHRSDAEVGEVIIRRKGEDQDNIVLRTSLIEVGVQTLHDQQLNTIRIVPPLEITNPI